MEEHQLEMFEELMKRDDDLAMLQEQNSKLMLENRSMRKTIDTILRVKCKRGEGAFSLNIELKPCIEQNAHDALDHCIRKITTKSSDVATQVLLSTLVGVRGTFVPCAVLHNHPPLVVYKDNDLWVVKNVNEFSELFYKHMQCHVMRFSKERVNDDTTDTEMSVINTLLNPTLFSSCVKSMLKMYKDY